MKKVLSVLVAALSVSMSSLAIADDLNPLATPKKAASKYDFSEMNWEAQYLIAKNGCNNCHSIDVTRFGPAFRNVADRYRDKQTYKYHGFEKKYIWSVEMPMVAGLVKKVSQGGEGEWGSNGQNTPMPQLDPSGRNKSDITKIVKAILKLESLPVASEEGNEGMPD